MAGNWTDSEIREFLSVLLLLSYRHLLDCPSAHLFQHCCAMCESVQGGNVSERLCEKRKSLGVLESHA